MCARFAADARLRMLCLEADGTTVAMICAVVAGEGVFQLKKAYDERFARFSPGVLLEIEAIRVFHEGAAAWMDSCTNHETDPLFSLWPDSRSFTSLVVTLGGVIGEVAMSGLVPALRRLRATLRAGESA
jgi:CelD/BcsL family acetyltransferase involved in cellulose biosynthesis